MQAFSDGERGRRRPGSRAAQAGAGGPRPSTRPQPHPGSQRAGRAGLEQVGEEQSRPERERTLAAARSELAKARARLERAELGLQAAREREQLSARTHTAFAQRARQELASCPRCRKPLRGCDLLVSGRCPHCDKALSSLLVPSRFGSLVVHEYLALLGALGVLAGLAMAASAGGAG
ncbi:MAG: hypothetical protein ACRDNP_01350 [Gaiellaceae bacterium]